MHIQRVFPGQGRGRQDHPVRRLRRCPWPDRARRSSWPPWIPPTTWATSYGTALRDTPSPVEPNLDALEVDLGRLGREATWRRAARSSRPPTPTTCTLNLDSFFDIMKYSPGTEEYAVLWAIEHIHCDSGRDYDVVVYDTPPTALSLRFLAMPAISNLWVAELDQAAGADPRERRTVDHPDQPRIRRGGLSCVDKDDDKVYGRLGIHPASACPPSRTSSPGKATWPWCINPDQPLGLRGHPHPGRARQDRHSPVGPLRQQAGRLHGGLVHGQAPGRDTRLRLRLPARGLARSGGPLVRSNARRSWRTSRPRGRKDAHEPESLSSGGPGRYGRGRDGPVLLRPPAQPCPCRGASPRAWRPCSSRTTRTT
ncbi:MAG: hypothetical protein M0C28_48785 [Candidatus Moduliflexus flocculans]|nr:hypothetical protein [Candidatus Moduliflexus flocculans]